MCFEVKKWSKAKTAKENIICWKFLEANFQPFYREDYPPYKIGEKQKQEKLIKNKRILKFHVIEFVIYKGYHSYKHEEQVILNEGWWIYSYPEEKTHICQFKIPKGTIYYENDTEYVSETIIRVN